MSRFSTTVDKVLIDYFKLIQDDFSHYSRDEERACILMNNVQQRWLSAIVYRMSLNSNQGYSNISLFCWVFLKVRFSRVQLEKMYEMMGGDDLPTDAKDILNKLQNKLITRLDQLAALFGQSFLERITDGLYHLVIR